MILVYSGVVAGIKGFLIEVEVDVRPGLPGFEIVGLPSKTVRESRERVRSALRNSGFKFPAQKVIVNLAPAHYPKDGALFDLPIALGILAHQGSIRQEGLQGRIFAGELSLSGTLKRINGVLSLADLAQEQGCQLIVPQANGQEAALADTENLVLTPLCRTWFISWLAKRRRRAYLRQLGPGNPNRPRAGWSKAKHTPKGPWK